MLDVTPSNDVETSPRREASPRGSQRLRLPHLSIPGDANYSYQFTLKAR